ncbi:MAG: prepilin-type N-terminal cleavage/methylation domain-containing protein [Candidatus Omnitrophica bacterium]|nr:prepilin-type N-terminal cleavage/methylation domain-containing protein [Candidatus Omnitrophota bacterium]
MKTLPARNYLYPLIIMNKKDGLSLNEILIALVILSIVALGTLGVFRAGKMHIIHAKSRIQAGELSRLFLDYLSNHVRQDTWNSSANALSTGTRFCDSSGNPQQPGCPTLAERSLLYPNVTYQAKYDIADVPGTSGDLRRVTLTITWSE